MTASPRPVDEIWTEREQYWRRRLGRIRLRAEPVEVQLERYRRVTLVLTAVPVAIGCMFLALFSAFGRPEIGAVLALVTMAPIVVIAWVDHLRLTWLVRAYLRERTAFSPPPEYEDPAGTLRSPPGQGSSW